MVLDTVDLADAGGGQRRDQAVDGSGVLPHGGGLEERERDEKVRESKGREERERKRKREFLTICIFLPLKVVLKTLIEPLLEDETRSPSSITMLTTSPESLETTDSTSPE